MSLKRSLDLPPHSTAGPSSLSFDFAPPQVEEPFQSKKQRKLSNYQSLNPRGRPAAGTPHVLRAAKVETVEEKIIPEVEEEMKEVIEGEQEEEEVEVVAVSHKAARLAKRRKLAGLPEVEPVVVSTAGNTIAGMPGIIVGNTPGKSAFGIWLGNMNYSTTNKMLLTWLEERGIKEIVRINMPMGRRSGEMNRGLV